MTPGPCIVCGDTNYNLSCGGPSICPKCDCGHFDAATVMKQAKVIEQLRADLAQALSQVERLTIHLDSSQSLLVMISHLGDDDAGIAKTDWKVENLSNQLSDQILENRAQLSSTVRECKCQPLTRYTDSPHDPECPLSDAPQERLPE